VVFDAASDNYFSPYEAKIEEYCKKDVKKIYVVNKIDSKTNVKRLPDYQYVSCKTNEGIDDLLNILK
jgi:50S ribosomal subunit-associated GTPase HflX